MKVLIDSYNYVTQNKSGGVQIRIQNYVCQLAKKGINVKLFNKWSDKIENFDILHIFKLNTEDYQLIVHAKRIGIPIVISSIVPLEKSVRIRANCLLSKTLPINTGYSLLKKILDMADIVISQTNKEAEFICRNYKLDKSKIRVIPNGVIIINESKHSNLIYKKLDLDRPYVLQVGRFDSNKNQLSVIKAMKDQDVPIIFVGGSNPKQPQYFEYCKQIASQNMHFLGWIKNDDPLLESIYVNAHVVVLPSHKEIFGNSLIEGGAVGANLVATRELPLNDWGIANYCSLINPGDLDDIRNKILIEYKKPKTHELKILIRKKFSWDSVVKEHINIYKLLLG